MRSVLTNLLSSPSVFHPMISHIYQIQILKNQKGILIQMHFLNKLQVCETAALLLLPCAVG